MEKHTPHCKLSVVKTLINAGRVTATGSAAAGARAVGIDTLSHPRRNSALREVDCG